MNNTSFSMGLFPLSAHILPQGRMTLRIFEARYVALVKEACASGKGFGICMLDAEGDKRLNTHIYSVGTHVKVIDFDLLDDGLLGITVEGQRCFKINTVHTEQDGLRIGDCQWLEIWQPPLIQQDINPLDSCLQDIFIKYPELQSLYQQPKFSDPIWVIYRWLELIPVSAQQKQTLIKQRDYVQALEFLTQLVK
ncbi:MAG: Lon protease-like protein [Paraglaciecola sp.]